MRGKHTSKRIGKRSGLKLALSIVSVMLVLCTVIGGTVAWLIDETDPVVNTFTYGDINIDLEETDTNLDEDNDPTTNEYEMVPGNEITKDPLVTVKANSEDAWLFVKLEKSANFDTFMTYVMAEGWTELAGQAGVYYREVDNNAADQEFAVIKDNKVTVKGEVTKKQLNALNENNTNNYPTLTVTAYAVQRDADLDAIDSAEEAWALAVANATPNP